MLVSTQQDHDAIRRIGDEARRRCTASSSSHATSGRKVMEGVRESKEMGLYRQQYCGCIYSEWERYRDSGAR